MDDRQTSADPGEARAAACPVAWFADAVIYHVMLDRFSPCSRETHDRPAFAGGTLGGLAEKLPYIADLGFNTVWVSPFYACDSYHGYDVTDYFSVNPRWGTLADVEALVSAAGRLSLKVIADFVPNHCSARHPYFADARDNPSSPYRRWFCFEGDSDRYVSYMSTGYLPRLDLRHDAAAAHITRAALFWLGRGLAGFRLDHALGPHHTFWGPFVRRIKAEFPSAVLIGEAPFAGFPPGQLRTIGLKGKYRRWLAGRVPGTDATDLAMRAFVGVLDGCLDFTFMSVVHEALKTSLPRQEAVDLARRRLRRHYGRFPDGFFLPTFLDNHDCDRFAYTFRGPEARANLEAAAALQFDLPQPPVVYYGTEVGMTQPAGISDRPHHGDNLARQPMIWDENRQDQTVRSFYRELIARRGSRPHRRATT